MITQKSMYNLFKQISEKHTFIKDFGYGEVEDIEPFIGINNLYPLMWVSLNQSTIVNGLIFREYNIIVGDLLLNGRENYIDILDQTESICIDIFSIINQSGQDTFDVSSQPILTPFTERFSETLAGHTLNITIQTSLGLPDVGNCEVQLDGSIEYDPKLGTDNNNTK